MEPREGKGVGAVSDLVVDYDKIEELGTGLETIRSELKNSESIAEEYGEDVSHSGLADALDDFADNWSDKRQEIVEQIGTLAEIAQGSAQAFRALDRALADSVSGEGA